jgi:hypothetical protein
LDKMRMVEVSRPIRSRGQSRFKRVPMLHRLTIRRVAPAVGNAPTYVFLTGSPPTCGARWNESWSGRQVTLLLDLAPKASASLLGYIPFEKWSRAGGSHSAALVPETSVVAS